MSHSPDQRPRLSYGFASGTFQLSEICPRFCFMADDERTQAIALNGDWGGFFRELKVIGYALATAGSGVLSVTETWILPEFWSVPGTTLLVDPRSGTELDVSRLARGLAVVEQGAGGQEIASFQFFDDTGAGCLKVMMTNYSDLDGYLSLASEFGCGLAPGVSVRSSAVHLLDHAVSCAKETVARLWLGMARSLPESYFPGLEGVTRLSALRTAGGDHAWLIRDAQGLVELLATITRMDSALCGTVRNRAVFLPSLLHLSHWSPCCCGSTFFSAFGQLSQRDTAEPWEAWVTKFRLGDEEVYCVEYFDANGHFTGALGLRDESSADSRLIWNATLADMRE